MALCVTQFAVYHKPIMPSLHMIAFHLGQQNHRPPGKTWAIYDYLQLQSQPPPQKNNKPAKLQQK